MSNGEVDPECPRHHEGVADPAVADQQLPAVEELVVESKIHTASKVSSAVRAGAGEDALHL